ncbi:UNVERIFIED_CONTAM: hypothetical protein GTU68_031431 [Idotea baltica]|nr:hypothetical protein [Idotea baltica]
MGVLAIRVFLQRPLVTSQIRLIRQARLAQIILYELGTKPTVYRLLFQIVQITTGLFNFQKN